MTASIGLAGGAGAADYSVGSAPTFASTTSIEDVQALHSGYYDDTWRDGLPALTVQPDGTAEGGYSAGTSGEAVQSVVDDTTAFPSGVRIRLAAGEHTFPRPVVLRSNVAIEGAGMGATTIVYGGATDTLFRSQPFLMGADHPAMCAIGRDLGEDYLATVVSGLAVGSVTCRAEDRPLRQGTYTRPSDWGPDSRPEVGQLVMIADLSFGRDGGQTPPPATHNFIQIVKVVSVEGDTLTFDEPRVVDWGGDGSGVLFWPTGAIDGSSGLPSGFIENIRLEGFSATGLRTVHRRGGTRNLLMKDIDWTGVRPEFLAPGAGYNGLSCNVLHRSSLVNCRFTGNKHTMEIKHGSCRALIKDCAFDLIAFGGENTPAIGTGEGDYAVHFLGCTVNMPAGVEEEGPSMVIRHQQFGGSYRNLTVNLNGYRSSATMFDMYMAGDHPAGYTVWDNIIANGPGRLRLLWRLANGSIDTSFLSYRVDGEIDYEVSERNFPLPTHPAMSWTVR